jgi:hypothetical protein
VDSTASINDGGHDLIRDFFSFVWLEAFLAPRTLPYVLDELPRRAGSVSTKRRDKKLPRYSMGNGSAGEYYHVASRECG